MDLIKGIETRRSIRGFKDTAISKETIEKILTAASNSPSFKNTQPWEVAVVSGKMKKAISKKNCDLVQQKVKIRPDIPRPQKWPPKLETRSTEHGKKRLASLNIERSDEVNREKMKLANYNFYGAPCAIFIFMEGALNEWSIFDIGLFTQNLILAAHAFGVESCLQASVIYHANEIKTILKISQSKKLIIAISLGYPDDRSELNSYRAVKQNIEEFTTWYS